MILYVIALSFSKKYFASVELYLIGPSSSVIFVSNFGEPISDPNTSFEGSFVEGWHGGPTAWGGRPRKTNPKTYPSPWEMIEDFYNRYEI